MAMSRRDWVLRLSTAPDFLEVDPEAAIALDAGGRVIGMTHAAQAALGDGTPLLGQRLEDLADVTTDDLPDLMRGRPAEDRVIRLRDGRALFGHAIAPQAARLPRGQPLLPGGLSSLAGGDPAMGALLAQAARLAPSTLPLLIAGETGTGKERLARAIHLCRPEPAPLRVIDCAGGEASFDAAWNDEGGTLLLRGVEDLSAGAQALLLRQLAPCKLRVLATTRCDLAAAVARGAFRADLFFRIAGAALPVPPLRMRQDLDWLIDRLLQAANADGLRLSAGARAELKARSWPGNLRELAATLQAAVLLAEGTVIDARDLPPPLLAPATETRPDDDLRAVLEACGWNMALAARRLGVNRSTVLRRMQRLGLTVPN
ncbi:sigma-54-dependent Fis family transcriptional regulator, partial [Paracoccus sp. (in: a-proteobacteria)]|uniref:sigma-54-dependent Fis family transcriptional regulator n=1 Tax=Paracoccus sp. TaxID=267 RepID=UPI0035B0DF49